MNSVHYSSLDWAGIEWCLIMLMLCGIIGWLVRTRPKNARLGGGALRWLYNLWWARQRRVDLALLWPACKERTRCLADARRVFAAHTFQDPCWIRYYGKRRLMDVIGKLK